MMSNGFPSACLVLATWFASATALAQEPSEQSAFDPVRLFAATGLDDWIRSCTDSSVDPRPTEGWIAYSINSGSETVSVLRCLLATVDDVPDVKASDGWLAVPFRSALDGRLAENPEGWTGIVIGTATRAIVIAETQSDWGISEVDHVSGDLLLITTPHLTGIGVHQLDPNSGTVEYLTNGMVEVVDEDTPLFKVRGRKHYFKGGGAFWIDALIDSEGNILDVTTQGGLCMSVDELSERSGLDLTRVVRPEVCVER
ncbi:MAG: hypothetical protein F4X98_04185 [Gammaproteobacteria bacterium]|nr:hypothetical protein [Gammaproteobacteria bacterium]